MKYKLRFSGIKDDIRNGIYTNFDDLAAILLRETVEYKYSHSQSSYEKWFEKESKNLETLLKETESNFIELNGCRITLLKD